MLRTISGAFLALAIALPIADANAQADPQAVVWASACFSCHGPDGRSEGGMPPLAGMTADAVLEAMIEFRSGERPATVMHQHARGYTEEQLRRIADALGSTAN